MPEAKREKRENKEKIERESFLSNNFWNMWLGHARSTLHRGQLPLQFFTFYVREKVGVPEWFLRQPAAGLSTSSRNLSQQRERRLANAPSPMAGGADVGNILCNKFLIVLVFQHGVCTRSALSAGSSCCSPLKGRSYRDFFPYLWY
jgi:hypothetical protein